MLCPWPGEYGGGGEGILASIPVISLCLFDTVADCGLECGTYCPPIGPLRPHCCGLYAATIEEALLRAMGEDPRDPAAESVEAAYGEKGVLKDVAELGVCECRYAPCCGARAVVMLGGCTATRL